jgi:hypothetical protein
MNRQNIIFDIVYEVYKDSQDVSAGIGILRNNEVIFPQFNIKLGKVNFDLAWYN